MSANGPRLSFAGGTLVLEGFSGRGRPMLGGGAEWIWDDRVPGWRCDAIAYPALRTDPLFTVARIADVVSVWHRVTWPKSALRKLRPEQQQAVARWNQTGRGCIVMPPGTGKTEVALHLIAGAAV